MECLHIVCLLTTLTTFGRKCLISLYNGRVGYMQLTAVLLLVYKVQQSVNTLSHVCVCISYIIRQYDNLTTIPQKWRITVSLNPLPYSLLLKKRGRK